MSIRRSAMNDELADKAMQFVIKAYDGEENEGYCY